MNALADLTSWQNGLGLQKDSGPRCSGFHQKRCPLWKSIRLQSRGGSPSKSGSLAVFAAIRRASSRVKPGGCARHSGVTRWKETPERPNKAPTNNEDGERNTEGERYVSF
jgi:hypothetical protein